MAKRHSQNQDRNATVNYADLTDEAFATEFTELTTFTCGQFPHRKFVYPVIAAVTGPILIFAPSDFFGT